MRRTTSLLALAAAAGLSLTGCGGSDEAGDAASSSPTASSSAPAPSTELTEDPGESPSATATPAEGDTPSWAQPAVYDGTKLGATTVSGSGLGRAEVAVSVYQVDRVDSPSAGTFSAAGQSTPKIKKGDPLIVLDYVLTNNGKAPVTISDLGVQHMLTLGKKKLGNEDVLVDPTFLEQLGLHGEIQKLDYGEDTFPLKPGESISLAEAVLYPQDKPLSFVFGITPVKNGEVSYDDETLSKPLRTTPGA